MKMSNPTHPNTTLSHWRTLLLATVCIAATFHREIYTCEGRRLADLQSKLRSNRLQTLDVGGKEEGIPSHFKSALNDILLDSSIFMYRGGDAVDDDTDESYAADKLDDLSVNTDDTNASECPTDNAEDTDHKVANQDEQPNIHVETTLEQSGDDGGAGEAAAVAMRSKTKPHKKSNAVGDPDGNSSDDESDEEDEDLLSDLEELEIELAKQRMQHQGEGMLDGHEELQTLVEMAERRDGMKQRIAEMEMELKRRNVESAVANNSDEEDVDIIIEEEDLIQVDVEDLDDTNEASIDSSTSYHLAGNDVAKEDAILKRQRKYKRGFLTKKSGGGTKKRRTSDATEEATKVATPAVRTNIDSATMDKLLVSAFRSMVFLPPPAPRLPSPEGSVSLKNIDVSSRRRLDRRTLYHGLLAELGGSHHHHHHHGDSKRNDNSINSMIRRKYLDSDTSRALKGALSLACQPMWRERLMVGSEKSSTESKPEGSLDSSINEVDNEGEEDDDEDDMEEVDLPGWWYRGGVCLFPPLVGDETDVSEKRGFSSPPSNRQFEGQQGMGMDGSDGGGFFGPDLNEDENNDSLSVKPWRCTMGMQETVAMALAHSLSCGLALIDDDAFAAVRKSVDDSLAELASECEGSDLPTINPEELRNSALLDHLVRLASGGALNYSVREELDDDSIKKNVFGKVSDRMQRDMELGLDDANDELAVESIRMMKEDEKTWFEPSESEEGSGDSNNGDPLSLVLFLRSDSSPSILKSKSAVERLAHECVKRDGTHLLVLGGRGIDASSTTLPGDRQVGTATGRMNRQQSMPNQPGKPFSFMSNFPPGSSEFNAQMQQNNKETGQVPGAFNANNVNASGVNDPEGSRRFNIFLARTVDQTGRPQIMGTIAPPNAGNLFPTILANMAKENLRKLKEEGVDEDNEQQAMFMKQMEDLVNQSQQMSGADGNNKQADLPSAAFFNATITSPFGSEVMNQNNDGEDNSNGPGNFKPPPEAVRRAIQDAMSGVIDRLAQMSSSDNGSGGGIPMNIAKAFSQVLSNENLRRGIADNLSRAAPALIDPRCQGVMLSVYVPPGPDHPNKGMMPGDQFKNKRQPPSQPQQQQPQQGVADKSPVPHGMGGWLNKILSHSSDKGKSGDEGETTPAAAPYVDDTSTLDEDGSTNGEKPAEETSPDEEAQDATNNTAQSETTKPSKLNKGKRKRSMDRARTLAVAAAALAGAKKEQREKERYRSNTKLTSEQKAERNLMRLQALCRSIPLPTPIDPVRHRAWDAWADREESSVIFRKNRSALMSHLARRNLGIEINSGTRGAGIVLRQMMGVRDFTEEMDDIVKFAVEIEAGKSQKHHSSPWGVTNPAIDPQVKKHATDKSLINFLNHASSDDDRKADGNSDMQFIHPSSLESALSAICGVSPSPGSQGTMSSSSGVLASHRSKEDLMALAQDKHERALIPNCVSPNDIGVTYDMIGGLTDVKELLRQSITYPLKFPHLYSEGIAREAVKGVLLYGPPGTGKTMLAKAVATEGGASFLSVDASSVENKWLGESEKNAKAVFTLARRLAPCVIFIDEVDSLLSSREGSSDDSAHGTLTSVKTTMMSEWDGLNSGTNGKGDAGSDRVVVIGSTNRPFDLDEAVLRRFPRRILVDLPDLETRREILEVTLSENRLGSDVNLTMIAERLEGYTGSDLKEVCREAVVQISHEQARMLDRGELLDDSDDETDGFTGAGFQMLRPVTMKDFESAMRKLKRSVSETGRELQRVWEWNDEYGEIKRTSKKDALPQMMNMFL
mmetsp:Transcript_20621/g.44553  ORF Transcript_20621/g.44553 Transcript_20621/m.44553 type:complete len:1773 (+) Transcript_20621:195-5513(+)